MQRVYIFHARERNIRALACRQIVCALLHYSRDPVSADPVVWDASSRVVRSLYCCMQIILASNSCCAIVVVTFDMNTHHRTTKSQNNNSNVYLVVCENDHRILALSFSLFCVCKK